MSQTTATGLPVPTSGDACDVPADMLTLASALDGVTVPLFGSTSDRNTAYADTPFKMCVVGTDIPTGTCYMRVGTSWLVVPTASIAVTTGVATDGANGTIQGQWMQSMGPWRMFWIASKYTGSDQTTSSTGSFAAVEMASLAWTPASYGGYMPINSITYLSDGNQSWSAVVTSAGKLQIRGGYPSVTLSKDDLIYLSGVIPGPSS